jgi:hypothetical protein
MRKWRAPYERLRERAEAGLVEQVEGQKYQLTSIARDLGPDLQPLV